MTVKLLTEHHLEFLSLKGGCTGLSESTLVKMPHCWKSHVTARYNSLNISFECSKEPSNRDGSFAYPQYILLCRNKKNNLY